MAKFDFSSVEFASGEAETSMTYPVKCSSLRRGGYVILQGFPCKIMEMSKAQPGKHGHAKIHLIGLDMFTGKKHEDICQAKENIEVHDNYNNVHEALLIFCLRFLLLTKLIIKLLMLQVASLS